MDGRALGDDSAYRGIGTYLRNVLTGLGQLDTITTSALVTAKAVVPAGVHPVRVRRFAPGRWAGLEHEIVLPFDLRRVDADVVHSPAQDPPARCEPPWVQTLHDVVPLLTGTAAERRRWRRAAARIRRASAVIAVSRWSADTGIRTLGLDASKVHVVHHGVSDRFRPAVSRDTAAEPYLLFVGEYDPRKRHGEAFAAVGALADRGLPHRLVVAGRIAPWYEGRIRALAASAPRPDRIELTGFVDEARLLTLYQNADALLVTSAAEGFGFPALEAMACGTPVVAFANSAIAEVLDGGATLVADGDVAAMVEALHVLLTADQAWTESAAAARDRAQAFSWARCVARHAEIFSEVAA